MNTLMPLQEELQITERNSKDMLRMAGIAYSMKITRCETQR